MELALKELYKTKKYYTSLIEGFKLKLAMLEQHQIDLIESIERETETLKQVIKVIEILSEMSEETDVI